MKHAHMRTNEFPLKSDHFKRKGDPFASIFFLGPCSGGVHTWNIHTWFIFLKTSPLFCFNYFPPAENNNWPDKNGSSPAFFLERPPPELGGSEMFMATNGPVGPIWVVATHISFWKFHAENGGRWTPFWRIFFQMGGVGQPPTRYCSKRRNQEHPCTN